VGPLRRESLVGDEFSLVETYEGKGHVLQFAHHWLSDYRVLGHRLRLFGCALSLIAAAVDRAVADAEDLAGSARASSVG